MAAPEPIRPSTHPRAAQDRIPKPQRKRPRKRHRRRWYWRLLRLMFVAYMAVLVTMAYLENRLVYPGAFAESAKLTQPPSIDFRDPASLATAVGQAQTLRYGGGGSSETNTDDDLPGRIWLLPGESRSRNWVIFFHGNGIRAVDLDQWIARVGHGLGANVMAAEYRGFTDDRKVSETGVIADGLAAVSMVSKVFDVAPSRMVFWGRSLGGGVAAAAAIRYPPAALVMDRTFDSTVAVAAARYWYLPVSLLMKNRFDSAARMSVYQGPLVVVHGQNDVLVPFAAGRRLFDAAISRSKIFLDPPLMGHLDRMPDETFQQVTAGVHSLIRSHNRPGPDVPD